MPDKAVSVFNYAAHHDGRHGSIWAQTMSGGYKYQQFFSTVQYGGYWQMPLDYLHRFDDMTFPAIGRAKDRPVGAQIRPTYLAEFI